MQVVDLKKEPHLARERIVAMQLVRQLPTPILQVIGDLSAAEGSVSLNVRGGQ
ncbi:MAG: circadian clock KaiB family protein [Methylocystis sp.]